MEYESLMTMGQRVTFPEWRGERHYMLPFTTSAGLPREVQRFQTTVDQMLDGVGVDPEQTCFIMVDEKLVAPAETHRRPGLHADGFWWPELQCHGGGGHAPSPPPAPAPEPVKKPKKNKRGEGLLLASNYTAARALLGTYERDFFVDWRGGDCAELDTSHLREAILLGGFAYHLDVFTLHESLPVREPVRRTLVRLNVPGAEIRWD